MNEMTGSRSVLWFLVVLGSGLSVRVGDRLSMMGSRLRVVRRGMVHSFMMRNLVVLRGGMVRCLMMLRCGMMCWSSVVGWSLMMLWNLLVLDNRL